MLEEPFLEVDKKKAREDRAKSVFFLSKYHLAALQGLQFTRDMQHATVLLMYLSFVDMVVSTGIGTTDGHDDEVTALDKVIVDGRLQLVGVFLDPFAKVDGKGNHCEGVYKG